MTLLEIITILLLLSMALSGLILMILVSAMLYADWKRARDEARYRKED